MSPTIFWRQSVILLLVIFFGLSWTGCSTTVKEQQSGQPVSEATGEKKTEATMQGKYYLDDVRVPNELDYRPGDSMVYETPKFKAGLLRFTKWRLDVPSLIDFFLYNMPKDNWTFINSFRGKEIQLSFSKPDKMCNIRISQSWTGVAYVMILVGPLGEKKM